MDYIELRKKNVYKKYHDSDIFNIKNDSNIDKSYKDPKYKTAQQSLEKTKNDIFNTKEKNVGPTKTKALNRRKLHLNNYKSDIFNINLNDIKKKSCQRMNINHSTCFDGMKNDEEYNKDLNQYEKKHRPKQKEYEIDKYFNKESAIGRYYKELYGDEKSGIFPKKDRLSKTVKNSPVKNKNNTFKNNMDNFENRKRKLKKELNDINDVGVDGKKRPGEHLGQAIDSKGNKMVYNKKKVDLYGENIDIDNNKKIVKEKNRLGFNHKLNKQLEYQSNIFNEEKKDINTAMNDLISNKIKEKENQKKLKEKIKKEREEKEIKIKDLKKKI